MVFHLPGARTARIGAVAAPPGASRFRSRQGWGRRVVAYASQLNDATGRAHLGQARIKSRLIGHNDPDVWDLRRSRNGCGGA